MYQLLQGFVLDVSQSASRSGCLKSVRCPLSYLDVDTASWFLFREGFVSTRTFSLTLFHSKLCGYVAPA